MLAFWWSIGGEGSSWREIMRYVEGWMNRAEVCAVLFICGKGDRAQRTRVSERGRESIASVGKGEDCEIAFAGEDDGEEAAVGRDVEFANGETVEERLRSGLHYGDGIAGFLRG